MESTITTDIVVEIPKQDAPSNHPFKSLLLNFEHSPDQLSPSTATPLKSLHETPLQEISNKDDFEKLIQDLKLEKELGFDVEWSDHGYKIVTCLVQISTRDKDFIIDAISLRDHISLLNELTTNVNIVKIFHCASNDLKQLQQDCDVYVVNMFDTQKAMKALGREKLGLDAALMEFGVKKNKRLQRADFRIRPLSQELKDYARTDSHFLINMYCKLKNELIKAGLLKEVLDECLNDCNIVHEKVEDCSYVSVRDDILNIHAKQIRILEKLNSWRHRIAESVDKNTGVVLSKNNMKALVLTMPGDRGAIVNIARSEYVRQHLDEVVNVMRSDGASSSFQETSTNKRKFEQTDLGRNRQSGPYRKNYRHSGKRY